MILAGLFVASVLAALFAALWWSERDRRLTAEQLAGVWKAKSGPTGTIRSDPGPEERAELAGMIAVAPLEDRSVKKMAKRYRERYPKLTEKQAENAAQQAAAMMGVRLE